MKSIKWVVIGILAITGCNIYSMFRPDPNWLMPHLITLNTPAATPAEADQQALALIDVWFYIKNEEFVNTKLKELIAAGMNPNLEKAWGGTLLLKAIEQRNADAVRMLLAAGANPNLRNFPLIDAVLFGTSEIVKELLNAGADPDIRYQQERTEAGENLQGMTPLMLAVTYGNVPMARLLIDAGTDITLKNQAERTALDIAIAHGKQEIINLLSKQKLP